MSLCVWIGVFCNHSISAVSVEWFVDNIEVTNENRVINGMSVSGRPRAEPSLWCCLASPIEAWCGSASAPTEVLAMKSFPAGG
jgi:hypothetical protein